MIPFKFSYVVPDTIEEAVQAWNSAEKRGVNPLYYSGGTEIITLCRDQKIEPGLIIDIKKIPDCNTLVQNETSTFGSALTLNKIIESTNIPILARTLERIADHTIRNKLTLGGNIIGRLPYREAVLPFMVLYGSVQIASANGIRTENISDFFNKRMLLKKGELLVNLSLKNDKNDNWFYKRKEKSGIIDYPILTACFTGKPGNIKMALSGSFSYPIRDKEVEIILNNKSLDHRKRAAAVVDSMNNLFRSDFRASADYRKHLLKLTIKDALIYLEKKNENIQ